MRLPGAVRPNSIWIYDIVRVADRHTGAAAWSVYERRPLPGAMKAVRNQFVDGLVLDEHIRECLAIFPASWLHSQDVPLTLSRLMRATASSSAPAVTTGWSPACDHSCAGCVMKPAVLTPSHRASPN